MFVMVNAQTALVTSRTLKGDVLDGPKMQMAFSSFSVGSWCVNPWWTSRILFLVYGSARNVSGPSVINDMRN